MLQRLTNGGVVAEGWLRLQGLMQAVLAVLRTELAAVAVVAADEPLAAWEAKGGGLAIARAERGRQRARHGGAPLVGALERKACRLTAD